MVFKKNFWAFLGPCVWGMGAPLVRYLCTTWESLHKFFAKMWPWGGTDDVSFELFLGILRGLGRGEGGPLVRYLSRTHRSLHGRSDPFSQTLMDCQASSRASRSGSSPAAESTSEVPGDAARSSPAISFAVPAAVGATTVCLWAHAQWANCLVAFQTQTQNRSVLATRFPNRNPAPGGNSKSQL